MEKKEKDNEYVDFVVTARKYKTTLTAKYKNRKMWHKPFVGDVISHLPGTIVKVEVQQGQEVAPVAGTIVELGVTEGDKIPKDHLMVKIQPK